MDYSWAKPGVKCVKFRSYTPPEFRHIRFIRSKNPCPLNTPVTITGLSVHEHTGVVTVLLAEHPNIGRKGYDIGWYIGNFRPLITKTQEEDVALFKSLLTGAPMGVEA